ncbi:MAG: HEAT repeat domain-containing protein, partial [Gemmatimonas sp.]
MLLIRPMVRPSLVALLAFGCSSLRAATGSTQVTTRSVSERGILEAQHARSEDVSLLVAAIGSNDSRLQRMAVRALGRFERPALRDAITPALTASDPLVRAEAVNALGQSNASFSFRTLLSTEQNTYVRGVIFETIGRVRTTPDSAEIILARGLSEASVEARAGAARGLESLLRRTPRTARPSELTLIALRRAARDTSRAPIATELRENALLAMSAAGDRDSVTAEAALRDSSEQVRRVAVSLLRRFTNDASYIVRLQALRYAGTCERFIAATSDENEHVVLAALDTLGARTCDNALLARLADDGRSWRVKAHALVSLARQAPNLAKPRVVSLATSPTWQARVYAAVAARLLGDSATLGRLARDAEPNVAITAMT